jgi:hypothetical protein
MSETTGGRRKVTKKEEENMEKSCRNRKETPGLLVVG